MSPLSLSIFLALLLCPSPVVSLKFLAYIPMFGTSHVTFLGKLVDVLVDAGHEVTIVGPVITGSLNSHGSKRARIISIPANEATSSFADHSIVHLQKNVWKAEGIAAFTRHMFRLNEVFSGQCETTLSTPGLLDQLRAQNFDAAFAEPFDFCGFGIFHALGIEKVALTLSLAVFEGSFGITGLPSFPSYVPGMASSYSDKMTFLQRTSNLVSLSIVQRMFPYKASLFDRAFSTLPHFPGTAELLSRSSLLFLNAEPLIEFPRPTLHSVIDIGGISVAGGPRPLNSSWSSLLDLRPFTVLLSFGTVAKSHLMPEEYKNNIRETFAKFPNVTFICKYEKPEHRISEGIDNIVEATYIPQNDMLYDPRLSLFITHGGQGSTTEATTAGVPLIVIPIMFDQTRNAAVITRLGSGVSLSKHGLEDGDALEKALRDVLGNPEYKEKARRTGQMIRDRPFTPRETFVRNMEFLARYGPLTQLDHYGKELNFFQFYLIDVFAFLGLVVLVVVVLLCLILRSLFRFLSQSIKAKKE